MALRTGTTTPALKLNALASQCKGGKLELRGSPRPASKEDAATGTLLATITKDGGSYTAETKATAVVVLAGGSGSIDTVKVGGALPLIGAAVAFNTNLATTTDDLADAINAYVGPLGFVAVSDGTDTVTLTAPPGLGAGANGLTLAVTATTLTATINGGSSAAFGGTGSTAGVTAVNGLTFDKTTGKTLVKTTGEVWADLSADASGTAVWYRFYRPDGTAAIDGSVGTTGSGADLTMASTTITAAEPVYVNTYSLTQPNGE